MSKKQYLSELLTYLIEKEVVQKDIDSIISDYEMLYQEALDSGLTEKEVKQKLGSKEEVFELIKDDLKFRSKPSNKLVAISPFIAVISFFLIGTLTGTYEYAWLVFLLIPVSAIILNVRGTDKLIAVTPFIAVATFMLTGFLTGVWHPTWLVFLIIPVTAVTLKVKGLEKLVALMPFIVLVIYILVGTYVNPLFYVYGWPLFSLVAIVAIFLKPVTLLRFLLLVSIIFSVALHQYLGHSTGNWNGLWLIYLLPVTIALFTGDIRIDFGGDKKLYQRPYLILTLLGIIALYTVISIFVPNAWTWSWIVLLFIPMTAIYLHQGFKQPVAYMPFISTILFMLLGVFGGFWQFARLVYLLIPIGAILTNEKETE